MSPIAYLCNVLHKAFISDTGKVWEFRDSYILVLGIAYCTAGVADQPDSYSSKELVVAISVFMRNIFNEADSRNMGPVSAVFHALSAGNDVISEQSQAKLSYDLPTI